MKEMYDWVPWFGALAKKIADGGETYLIECAKRVEWDTEDPTLLNFGNENIDPFSFFYFVAQRNRRTIEVRKKVNESIDDVFEIGRKNDLDLSGGKDGFIIPMPRFDANPLFHINGEGKPVLLWSFFRNSVEKNDDIEAKYFGEILNINGVGVAKFTQCMFLMNPNSFMPIDGGILEFHDAFGFPSFKKAKKDIKDNDGWVKYQSMLQAFKSSFPGCSFYEINTALYMMNGWGKENIANKIFQISTHVHGSSNGDGEKYWEEFSEKNHVRTGGKASGFSFEEEGNSDSPYPLTEPTEGDIILVRTGVETGQAVGLVYKNEYAENGLTSENVIHVIWLNKSREKLMGIAYRKGFTFVQNGSGTYTAFANVEKYEPTFNIIRYFNAGSEGNGPELTPPNGNTMNYPLNQIFYGPPGTGKTYHTVDAVLKITDPEYYENNSEDRDSLLQRFEELREKGQIQFVTFHQSFGYEEFVEGIRPIMSGTEEGGVSYEIKDGVFKRLCENAAVDLRSNEFDDAIESLKQDCSEDNVNMKTIRGKEIIVKYFGRTTFSVKSLVTDPEEKQWTPVKIDHIKKIYRGADQKSAGFYSQPYIRAIINHIKEEYDVADHMADATTKRPYVLIIDEINRGNVSRIFGELITLVEESKRIGNNEEIKVTLPYSEESFGVPNNLYIIGTMNTADRSIALLDTALRRRFRFEEMMPDIQKLTEIKIEGINVADMLEAINKRIEVHYDRDHQIGHSYFMRLKDTPKLTALAEIFRHDILPLLQEYFYDDWGKIHLVLNRNNFLESKTDSDSNKKIWKVNHAFTAEEFRKIYEKSTNG